MGSCCCTAAEIIDDSANAYAVVRNTSNTRKLIEGIVSVLRCVLEQVNVLFPSHSEAEEKELYSNILRVLISVIRRQDTTFTERQQLECVRIAVNNITQKMIDTQKESSNTRKVAKGGRHQEGSSKNKRADGTNPQEIVVLSDLQAGTKADSAKLSATVAASIKAIRRKYGISPSAAHLFTEKLQEAIDNPECYHKVDVVNTSPMSFTKHSPSPTDAQVENLDTQQQDQEFDIAIGKELAMMRVAMAYYAANLRDSASDTKRREEIREMRNRAGIVDEDDVRGTTDARELEEMLIRNRVDPASNKNYATLIQQNYFASMTPEMRQREALLLQHQNRGLGGVGTLAGSRRGNDNANDLPHVLNMWYEADSDCSGNITEAELKSLLERINIDVSVMAAEKLLGNNVGSVAGKGSHKHIIDFTEFFDIYRRLTTVKDVKAIFVRFATKISLLEVTRIEDGRADSGEFSFNASRSNNRRASFMAPAGTSGHFHEINVTITRNIDPLSAPASPPKKKLPNGSQAEVFLNDEENYCMLREDAIFFLKNAQCETDIFTIGQLLEQFGFSAEVEGINFRQFQQCLLSNCNSWMHPREALIHHDMNQPLTHYFINSSHNTYLCGHQLTGKSSTDMYALALLNGSRCVELDCYDGSDGKPDVTHGNTLTTRIKYRDVCQTIMDTAFVNSPYPVTLSLEVHTSIEQQREMVKIMQEIFGPHMTNYDMAAATKLDGITFSPEALRGKILIKSKRKKLTTWSSSGVMSLTPADEDGFVRLDSNDEKDEAGKEGPKLDDDPLAINSTHISEELSNATFMPAIKFKNLKQLGALPHFGVSSVDEGKVESWYKAIELQQEACNVAKGFMVRVYPAGTRMDSSNMDPQLSWNIGAQMSAMNIQTQDRGNRLNFYKFRYANSNCGYLLKPHAQRGLTLKSANNVFRDDLTLRVTVMFGFSLPRPNNSKSGDIADPYVELSIRGYGDDDSVNGGVYATATAALATVGAHPGAVGSNNVIKSPSQPSYSLANPNKGVFAANQPALKSPTNSTVPIPSGVFGSSNIKNPIQTTRTVDDNGFKPSWSSDHKEDDKKGTAAKGVAADLHRSEGETFTFHINAVELATLCIRIMDRDVVGAGFMAESAIPLASIRQGYRQVSLYNNEGRELPGPTCLFINLKWEQGVEGHRKCLTTGGVNGQPPRDEILKRHFFNNVFDNHHIPVGGEGDLSDDASSEPYSESGASPMSGGANSGSSLVKLQSRSKKNGVSPPPLQMQSPLRDPIGLEMSHNSSSGREGVIDDAYL